MPLRHPFRPLCLLLFAALLPAAAPGSAPPDPRAEVEALSFEDGPGVRDLAHPEWFKNSFMDLREDLREAVTGGKRLVVYFGQRHCAYCEAMMEVDFGKEDIVSYTRRHFDIVPIDIWSDVEIVDLQGQRLSEKAFAEREKSQFTPTLVFYDAQGREVFRLRGYYPPYQFRAALEYVADGHYAREGFREYLARAEPNLRFEAEDLVDDPLFARPPYILDRSRFPADRPLVVLFEQGNCHACDVLHTEQFRDPTIRRALEQFEVVQLNPWGETPVVTPDGRRLTASQWAHELGLFYSPTLLFFDERGQEIIRIDSVVRFHRLTAVLDFVQSKDYLAQPYFQRWREDRATRATSPPAPLPPTPPSPPAPPAPPARPGAGPA
ncbi:MAG: thioredoxin fold domain-containing protein [Gammaproteobacteria bacterium]|jgi:thioredoxin-related protein|nr:thioredoxin fold domain-containing protein [Gammaproteobacteria bacterium]